MKEEWWSFEIPSHDKDIVRLIDAIPDTWAWVDGYLQVPSEAQQAGLASERTGVHVDRHSSTASFRVKLTREEREAREVVLPDAYDILIEGKMPVFLSLNEAGYGTDFSLSKAKCFAAAYVRRGYRGWLTFRSNCNDNDKYSNNAVCTLSLLPRYGRLLGEDSSVEPRNFPPLIEVACKNRSYQPMVETILTICQEMDLQEIAYKSKR